MTPVKKAQTPRQSKPRGASNTLYKRKMTGDRVPSFVMTLLTVIVFAMIVWYAYPSEEERYSTKDLPIVRADISPYKFKPEAPGGMNIPNRESTVFEQIEKSPERNIESLFSNQGELKVSKMEPKLNLELKEAVAKPKKRIMTSSKKAIEPKKKLVAKKVEAVKKVTKTTKIEAAKVASSGTLYIQLGSFKDEAGAKSAWKTLQKKYPHFLSGLTSRIQRADLGSKGIYYRLHAGKLTATRAKSLCADLNKHRPGGCIVVR